ncbi:MAG: class I SAM-dependent methyltransferase [Candidatus Hydrogenedentes bacterium]|nr:class I SAM-dependent methyltransferase [Candidatus Hydrogenedentota bacterium]
MDVTQRFSDRVENYIKYRPGYPEALLDCIVARAGLSQGSAVADIGSGTGIFAALLLARGVCAYAVEPNREMREAAERLLGADERFVSVAGSAERTGLGDASADAICVAQAFHWFDGARARAEFKRILRPGGVVALIWNDRKVDATPFLAAYDALLRTRGTDYEQVNHRNVDAARLSAFFGAGGYEEMVFANEQRFDWNGLYGRAMSSTYVPAKGSPGHDVFVTGLHEVFAAFAHDGAVAFEYDTRLYLGGME